MIVLCCCLVEMKHVLLTHGNSLTLSPRMELEQWRDWVANRVRGSWSPKACLRDLEGPLEASGPCPETCSRWQVAELGLEEQIDTWWRSGVLESKDLRFGK